MSSLVDKTSTWQSLELWNRGLKAGGGPIWCSVIDAGL